MKKPENIPFFFNQIDQVLCQKIEQKELLNAVVPFDKKKEIKSECDYEKKMNKNADNVKEISFFDKSSSVVVHNHLNNVLSKKDFLLSVFQKKKMYTIMIMIENIEKLSILV